MRLFEEYELTELLHQGARHLVYRGRRLVDGRAVIVKRPRDEAPSQRDRDRLRHEYEVLRRFDEEQVVRALELVDGASGAALVLEDFGAVTLQGLLGDGPLALAEFFPLALALTDALGLVHERGVTHGDIKPQNVLIDPATGRVALADFSAALLRGGARGAQAGHEGTLAFIAPEQTGRVNRPIDERSDLYALGGTFYRMLTGRTPFATEDPGELVHSHIARVPPAPAEVAGTPAGLSALVLKLLSKDPDDRYRGAWGLRADLERCLATWRERGEVAAFPLGERDRGYGLALPEGFCGRPELVAALADEALGALSGPAGVLLLEGPSGVGKSALLAELVARAVARGARSGAGEFDAFDIGEPHAPLVQAAASVLRPLLGASEAVLGGFLARLRGEVGDAGDILVRVAPELEPWLEQTGAGPALPPAETAQRFRQVVVRLLVTLASLGPGGLVLALDDLQSAPADTLKLLGDLLRAPDAAHLLVLATRRDGPAPALDAWLAGLAGAGVAVRRVPLAPLSRGELDDWLVGAGVRIDDAALVRLHAHTGGNPLHVRTLLAALHAQGLLVAEGGGWSFAEAALAQVRSSDDLGVLMSARIAALPPRARELLARAACAGDGFTLAALAVPGDRGALAADLQRGVELGLLRREGERYAFAHARVRQAVHAALDEPQRRRLHREIGLRLALEPAALSGSSAVAVAHHLGEAAALLSGLERRLLARACLVAGRISISAAAYEAALAHLRRGAAALPLEGAGEGQALALDLCRARMEAEYLAGDLEVARGLFARLLATVDEGERGGLHVLKVSLETSARRPDEALRAARAGLAALGYALPEVVTPEAFGAVLGGVEVLLRERDPAALPGAPAATDRRTLAAQRLLIAALPAAFFADPGLMPLLLLRTLELSLSGGVSEASALGFAGYAMLLVGAFGRHREAERFGRLAFDLDARFRNAWLAAKLAALVGLFVYSWTRPLPEVLALLARGQREGQRAGDPLYAAFCAGDRVFVAMIQGEPLASVAADTAALLRSSPQRLLGADFEGSLVALGQACAELRGPEADPAEQAPWDEDAFVARFGAAALNARFSFHLYRATCAVVLGDTATARAAIVAAEPLLPVVFASPTQIDFHFYAALTAGAALSEPLSGDERAAWERRLAEAVARLEAWSELQPANCGARARLAAAEQARVAGDLERARTSLDAAAHLARGAGQPHCEALALERSARTCRAQGYEHLVEPYLRAARAAYGRWGARARVEDLDRESHAAPRPRGPDAGTTAPTQALDLTAVLAASRAISSEIVIERLLARLIATVMESAGGRRAALLLVVDGALRVVAEADVGREGVALVGQQALSEHPRICMEIAHYVVRTGRDVVIEDALEVGEFGPALAGLDPPARSVLCIPVAHQGAAIGALYLEHELAPGVFTSDRLALLNHLGAQIGISIANARLYRSLDQARDRAVAADTFKTRFLLSMSHELRTPITAVIGYADLLAEEAEDGAPVDIGRLLSDLGKIRVSAARLLQTLTGLLELSSLDSGATSPRPGPVALGPLLDELVAELTALARDGGNVIRLDCGAVGEAVHADRSMLRYCLYSLLDNACRFTRQGEISVVARRVARAEAEWLRVAVSDTGVGMSALQLAHAFDAFAELGGAPVRAHEGIGVSLAVSRRFCRAMGGDLQVESAPGGGSTFTIELPQPGAAL